MNLLIDNISPMGVVATFKLLLYLTIAQKVIYESRWSKIAFINLTSVTILWGTWILYKWSIT